MFDDRLEISSPGGMPDGSIIQELDIKNIPSIRKNKIITDIFTRLDYVEKRGSGFKRIIEAYDNSDLKPEFISTKSYFIVKLPRKIYKKQESENKETEEYKISDEDYFFLKVHKVLPKNIKQPTKDHLIDLFNKYEFKYEFKRIDMENTLKLGSSQITELIKISSKYDLIEKIKRGTYKFKK